MKQKLLNLPGKGIQFGKGHPGEICCRKTGHAIVITSPHLSLWPSDLKINGTQENVTFSGPVFHGLSCGIFLFVASVSFKNHLLNGLNFSTANQVLLSYVF